MAASDPPASPALLWGGRALTALPILGLLMSGAMKLTHNPKLAQGFVGQFGYPEGLMTPIGIVEIACTLLFALPKTRVLGAILLTGYLGGAVATHVRVGDPFIAPLLLGVVVWAGLFLRDARLRALLPTVRE